MLNRTKITIGIIIILLIGTAFVFSTNTSLFRGFIKMDKKILVVTGAKANLVSSPTFVSQNITPGSIDVLVGKWNLTAKENVEIKNLGFDMGVWGVTGENAYKYFSGAAKLVDSKGTAIYSTVIQPEHVDGVCTPFSLTQYFTMEKGTSNTISLYINLNEQAPISSKFKSTLCSDIASPSSATGSIITIAAKTISLSASVMSPVNAAATGENISIGKWKMTTNADTEIKKIGFDIKWANKNAYNYLTGSSQLIAELTDGSGKSIYSTIIQPQHTDGVCTPVSLAQFFPIAKDTSTTVSLYAGIKPTASEGEKLQATLCSDVTSPPFFSAPAVTIVK